MFFVVLIQESRTFHARYSTWENLSKQKEELVKKQKELGGGVWDATGNWVNTLNISDGFSGNAQDPGWKNLGLPSVINN